MLLSWVLMGNLYPVTESVTSQESLEGTKLKEGFDSHYVLTKRSKLSILHTQPFSGFSCHPDILQLEDWKN